MHLRCTIMMCAQSIFDSQFHTMTRRKSLYFNAHLPFEKSLESCNFIIPSAWLLQPAVSYVTHDMLQAWGEVFYVGARETGSARRGHRNRIVDRSLARKECISSHSSRFRPLKGNIDSQSSAGEFHHGHVPRDFSISLPESSSPLRWTDVQTRIVLLY